MGVKGPPDDFYGAWCQNEEDAALVFPFPCVMDRQFKQSLKVHTPQEWCMNTGIPLDLAALTACFFTLWDTLLVNITTASIFFSFEPIFPSDLVKTRKEIPARSASSR